MVSNSSIEIEHMYMVYPPLIIANHPGVSIYIYRLMIK